MLIYVLLQVSHLMKHAEYLWSRVGRDVGAMARYCEVSTGTDTNSGPE